MRPKQPNVELEAWILHWFTSNELLYNYIRDNVRIDGGDEAPRKYGRNIVVGYDWLIAKAEEDKELKRILVRWML